MGSAQSSSANKPAAIVTVIPSPSANDPTAVEIQKINALYTNLNDENSAEYALYHDDTLDKKLIADTPLHSAAAAGETLLVMEIVTLKPSFARKLNGDGLSPMHLALQNRHIKTVRSLLTTDPELVRVKGKLGLTPLHCAVAMNETEILAEFLLYCPSAIKDLSSECESAMHIAIKYRRLDACKVIFGCLRKEGRSDLDRVLELKDADGNNVLHIATSTNQREVLELLSSDVSVCTRNLKGKSCLDLADQQDEEVMKILFSESSRELDQLKDVKELSHAMDLSCRATKSLFTRMFGHLYDQIIVPAAVTTKKWFIGLGQNCWKLARNWLSIMAPRFIWWGIRWLIGGRVAIPVGM